MLFLCIQVSVFKNCYVQGLGQRNRNKWLRRESCIWQIYDLTHIKHYLPKVPTYQINRLSKLIFHKPWYNLFYFLGHIGWTLFFKIIWKVKWKNKKSSIVTIKSVGSAALHSNCSLCENCYTDTIQHVYLSSP